MSGQSGQSNRLLAPNESSQDEQDTAVRSKKSIKDATDLQRLKLEKLLKNPEKPAFIPEKSKEKKMPKPPEFIRNTWGSSAGAGSGDFHVYRGVRRREYARQKFLDEVTEKKEKDSKYHEKVEQNVKLAEEKTAKKRAKRLKKKANAKKKKANSNQNQNLNSDSSSESDQEESESANKDQRKEDNSN